MLKAVRATARCSPVTPIRVYESAQFQAGAVDANDFYTNSDGASPLAGLVLSSGCPGTDLLVSINGRIEPIQLQATRQLPNRPSGTVQFDEPLNIQHLPG